MRRLGPRVPESYPLVEMTAYDGRADCLRRDQVVATGPGKLRLDACKNNSRLSNKNSVSNNDFETRRNLSSLNIYEVDYVVERQAQ